MLEVEQIGLLANVVDQGRLHSQAKGYSQSGPLDWLNFEYANAILGQSLSRPAIEVLGGHFSCRFKQNCLITITGANTDIFINNLQVKLAVPILIEAGDKLTLTKINSGLVNYIGFKCELNLPEFANSVCAVAREKSGGIYLDGRSLAKGDLLFGTPDHCTLPLQTPNSNDNSFLAPCKLSNNLRRILSAQHSNHKTIYIALTYQADLFSTQQVSQFTFNRYTISNHVDRMGMRLQGSPIVCANNVLSSQAIVYGAVQITGEGLPIIMRNDRQTIGGYPIIGVVDRLSMTVLGQASPGQSIKFELIDFEKSRQQRMLVRAELKKLSTLHAQLFTK